MNTDVQQAARTLDELHAAASRADSAAYFDLYTPDAVFMGTDGTERWTLPEFRAYAMPHFAKGQGWTYVPRPASRRIEPAGAGVLVFDELLDNEKYGLCRGTGVLVKTGEPARWRVRVYSLSFMIPNDVAGAVVAITKPATPPGTAIPPAPTARP